MTRNKTAVELIPHAVKTIRKNIGYTQGELADESGVDRKTINRIENRRHQPRISMLVDISNALGVPITVLVDWQTYVEYARANEWED